MSVANGTFYGAQDALKGVNGPLFSFAVLIAAFLSVMSGFGIGYKQLQRLFWFFDRMMGGAPHAVTLPGPPGLPLVGNLLEVSRARIAVCSR